jgi:UDP-N-acetylmuramoyl-L-alanyl-D-glutamate--2,6-diaminopimelate ligase
MGLRFSELLSNGGYPQAVEDDPLVLDVTEDSREVRPGWVFVAIPGTHLDGAQYISEALARGAVAVVAETGSQSGIASAVVPNARRALADLAAAAHGFPSRKLHVFGVTGTDGKTTTCYLLKSILDAAGLSTALITTVETIVGGKTVSGMRRLTTPSASFVQRTLDQMVIAKDECAVIECSSHALAQERLRNVELRGAAITNIASDHIEFHGSIEHYAAAKARIADLIIRDNRGVLLINSDDPHSMSIAAAMHVPFVTYGLAPHASLRATKATSTLSRTDFAIEWQGESHAVSLPVGGEYNVYNALAAIGVALVEGIPLATAASALATACLPRGRLQAVDAGQPFSVFVDYAHTEQAFTAVLRFLQRAAHQRRGRLIAVFGAAGDRDHSKRRRFAEVAAELCDYFVITNEDPFGEDAGAIIRDVAAGAPGETENVQWAVRIDRREAIALALQQAAGQDVVIITGKGHESAIDVGDRRIPWSDVEVTRDLITKLASASRPTSVGGTRA